MTNITQGRMLIEGWRKGGIMSNYSSRSPPMRHQTEAYQVTIAVRLQGLARVQI